jgi:hypothetical protein
MGMDQEGDRQPEGVADIETIHTLSIGAEEGADAQSATTEDTDQSLWVSRLHCGQLRRELAAQMGTDISLTGQLYHLIVVRGLQENARAEGHRGRLLSPTLQSSPLSWRERWSNITCQGSEEILDARSALQGMGDRSRIETEFWA